MTKIYYDFIDTIDPWLFETDKDVWVFAKRTGTNICYLKHSPVEIYIKRSQVILQYE